MKIREKLFVGFGLYLFFAVTFGILAYKDLSTISIHLGHLEISDDITNTLLEVRRYEKNYLLYGDPSSLEDIGKYLALLKDGIRNIRPEASRNIGEEHVARMLQSLADYEYRIGRLGQVRSEQERLRAWARSGKNGRLQALQREEKEIEEQLRTVARETQVYVEENARAERRDIARILKFSSLLLAAALGLIIVFGTVINI